MTEKKTAFIFPGQGTQTIGMGADLARDFAAAKEVFEEVDEALHQNLSHLMFEGDLAELNQTQNTQPAIMAMSMAVLNVLKSEGFDITQEADCVAGHSLGEYSALCAAGVLSLTDVAQLLQARGQAMAEACGLNEGGMLALIGATPEQAEEVAIKSGVYVANDNAVGQIVLSGTQSALEQAMVVAKEMQIKRAIPLAVAGAFHSPLMCSAAEKMASLLTETKFLAPKVPIYFNVTAEVQADENTYADLLIRQITAPVRWRETVLNMPAEHFTECGPGAVLAGLVKRTKAEAETVSLNGSEAIRAFLENN